MKIFIFLLFLSISINAQQYFIRGKVVDGKTFQAMSFTNIRIAGSTYGTAANKDGEYELKVNPGIYILIASYIGYNSDTISVSVKNNNISELNFYLTQTNIALPEIKIVPGEDPAVGIIRKAIARKEERNRKLNSYEYEAYTKGILKTEKDLDISGRRLNLSIGANDSSELKITAILENLSKGYFKKPNDYKEVILARKQSANLPPTLNIFTGGRLIQNFYENRVNVTGLNMPAPLADDALDYYSFYLKNILAINNNSVYEIFITPVNPDYPGFTGNIYISDNTYDLLKIDLHLNRAANVGGIFDTINVVQQFSIIKDSITMPIDYHILVKVNYLGLARFGFELNSILYDCKINPDIDDSFFNKAVVTVLPDADNKDSLYWKEAQTIPNTYEENLAYRRIDSLKSVGKTFGERFSLLSSRIDFSDYFSTNGPLSLYHFNRVEGHSLDFGFYLNDLANSRFYSGAQFSYGFADKKHKETLNASYLLGDYRTYRVYLEAFNTINVLFNQSEAFRKLTSTFLALFFKDDFRDYYYSKGFNIDFEGEVLPVLSLNAGFMNRTDNNANTNTTISVFKSSKTYRNNPPIYESRINALKLGFRLDFRDYIENGIFRRRTSFGKSYVILDGKITYSNPDFINSSTKFTKYEISVFGGLNSFRSTFLNYRIYGMYNKGELPLQLMYALPADINLMSHNYSFRTLEYNEITGDRVVTVALDYSFGTELFRMFNIPGLKDWDIRLNTFFNAAFSDISSEAAAILPVKVNTFNTPFYEIGFGLSHALIPVKIEFAWKLNHRGNNNFQVGFNLLLF